MGKVVQPDLWSLYRQMLRSRQFEELVKEFWEKGEISGEMHLGIGEEAVAAGVVGQLCDGDAMALDHRGTPPLVMRGVDLLLLLKELLGCQDGLCGGRGGHMHLFSEEHLAASSGIVGASGPIATGFALAAQYIRPGNIAVAFFGDGAMNQGMLMESLNLAAVWQLSVLFVCKNNRWAISTRSEHLTAGSILERARSFGMPACEVDGTDVEAVWRAAEEGIARARNGGGPSFLLTHCPRYEGHFLGDSMMRILQAPGREIGHIAGPLARSFFGIKGTTVEKRMNSLFALASTISHATNSRRRRGNDPLDNARQKLRDDAERLAEIERSVDREITQVRAIALSVGNNCD